MYVLGQNQHQAQVTHMEGVPLQLFGWALHRKGCSEGCVEEGLTASFRFFCAFQILNISLARLVPYSLLL